LRIGVPGLRGQQHADQPAHGRADPIHLVGPTAGEQRVHIGQILRIAVIRLMAQPVAATAPDHVGANDPIGVFQGGGQIVEIPPGTGQAVNADQDVVVGELALFGVMDTMETVGTESQKMF